MPIKPHDKPEGGDTKTPYATVFSSNGNSPQGAAYHVDETHLATARSVVDAACPDGDTKARITYADGSDPEYVVVDASSAFDRQHGTPSCAYLKLKHPADRPPLLLSFACHEGAMWHASLFDRATGTIKAGGITGTIAQVDKGNNSLVLNVDAQHQSLIDEVPLGTPIRVGHRVVGHVIGHQNNQLQVWKVPVGTVFKSLPSRRPSMPYDPQHHVTRKVEDRAVILLGKPNGRAVLRKPTGTGGTWLLQHHCQMGQRLGDKDTLWIEIHLDPACKSLDELARKVADQVAVGLADNEEELAALRDTIESRWNDVADAAVNLADFMINVALEPEDRVIVLVMDDADRLFLSPDSAELVHIFGILRTWTQDAREPAWARLRQLIAIATTQLCVSSTQATAEAGYSAYFDDADNQIRAPRDLEFDLTPDQVTQLAMSQIPSWSDTNDTPMVMGLVGGHPQYVQAIIHEVASGRSVADVVGDATLHEQMVKSLADMLRDQADPKILTVLKSMQPGMNAQPKNRRLFGRLVDAGLLVAGQNNVCSLRYRLYETLIRLL